MAVSDDAKSGGKSVFDVLGIQNVHALSGLARIEGLLHAILDTQVRLPAKAEGRPVEEIAAEVAALVEQQRERFGEALIKDLKNDFEDES
jgi:hypothetical protein